MSKGIQNISKMWKRLAALMCAIVLALTMNPPIQVHAMGEKWDCPGDGWYYLPGTDIKVKVEPDCITFEGNGALPDYNNDTLDFRPWNHSEAHYVKIGQGITYIGRFTFARLEKISMITMYSTTFMADATVFDRIESNPAIRIMGTEESTKMIGTIPFTSTDSIALIAQSGYNGATYIFDNEGTAKAFRNKTNPTIGNVFSAQFEIKEDDNGKKKDSPWFNPGDYTGDITFNNLCTLSPATPNSSYMVSGQKRIQGMACYEAFAAFIGSYQYGGMYRLQVMKDKKLIETTENPYTYVWKIPDELKASGRTFKMLAIGNGTVLTYDDEDTNDATFTMTTTTPSTSYCLVYVQ